MKIELTEEEMAIFRFGERQGIETIVNRHVAEAKRNVWRTVANWKPAVDGIAEVSDVLQWAEGWAAEYDDNRTDERKP